MTTMQFCDFTFPYNPRSLTVRHGHRFVSLSCPPFGEILQDLGRGLSTIQGEGEFFGPLAEANFASLRQLFLSKQAGALFLPAHEPLYARMDSLVLVAQVGTILTYQFHFTEDSSLPSYGSRSIAPTSLLPSAGGVL